MNDALKRYHKDSFGYVRYAYHQYAYNLAYSVNKSIPSQWTSRDDELLEEWIRQYQPRKRNGTV